MTTIAALEYEDMCVIVADRKASMGNLHAENVLKLQRIGKDRDIVVGGAGVGGDMLRGAAYLTSECNLYEKRKGMPIKAKAAASVLSNIVLYGLNAFYILAGRNGEKENPGVYSIDPAGMGTEDLTGIASVGSGSLTLCWLQSPDWSLLSSPLHNPINNNQYFTQA